MTAKLIQAAILALLAMAACATQQQDEPTNLLMQFSTDGTPGSWQSLDWHPDQHHYMRYGTPQQKGQPIRWEPALRIETCLAYEISDNGTAYFWIKDNAPTRCLPPPARNNPNLTEPEQPTRP